MISHDSGQYADANKNEHPVITDPSTNSGLTRRSFIKRSVVAAVAVSSMTIFSGLVNAGVKSAYDCQDSNSNGAPCTWKGGPKKINVSQGNCYSESGGKVVCTCTWKDSVTIGEHWECDG